MKLVLLLLAAPALLAASQPPVDPSTITEVIVYQSCHLDLGFADFSTNIINRFFDEHFPKAIRTAAQLRARGGGENLAFAVRPMLLSLYFNCPASFPRLDPAAFPATSPFATMTTPKPLHCPNATALAAVRRAIADGAIIFDAFPVSAQPEIYSPAVFSAGLRMVADLAGALGNATHRPRTLSQRDVPGLTRAAVPLLARAGVTAVSVGANGGSAAPDLPGYRQSREAQLSTPFVWKDEASGASVLAHVHPGGYGRLAPESGEGILSSCVATPALPGKALCFAFRGDNAGPPEVQEVLDNWASLRKAFPKAKIVRSTSKAGLDDYFGPLDAPAIRAQLPVVTSEVGDSWIYGCGSDPLKLAAMQVLQRRHDACVADPECIQEEERHREGSWSAFQRMLVLAGKHTWGGHTIIEDDGKAADTTHYTAAQLAAVRWTSKAFVVQQLSWNEMRLQLWGVREQLAKDSPLGQAIDDDMSLLTGSPAAAQPLAQGPDWQDLPRDQWGQPVVIGSSSSGGGDSVGGGGGLQLALDPVTGAIVSLQKQQVGGDQQQQQQHQHQHQSHSWASPSRPLARFAYVAHSGEQATAFFKNYSFGCPRCGWATEGFTKPGVNPALANASVTRGTVARMMVKKKKNERPASSSSFNKDAAASGAVDAIAYELQLPPVLWTHYGAPQKVFVEITSAAGAGAAASPSTAAFNVTLRWLNKTTTRLPEALWFEFNPAGVAAQAGGVELGKMGSTIRPNEVVVNGSALHATDASGVVFHSSSGGGSGSSGGGGGSQETSASSLSSSSSSSSLGGERLRVVGHHAPLVATKDVAASLNLWKFPSSPPGEALGADSTGVAFNLFNNLWNTNYVYWYPWRNASSTEDDAAMTFRWTVGVEG